MARREVDDAIAAIAQHQHAAFSLAQVEAAGGDAMLALRRRRSGRWQRRASGVFVLAGAPASWRQQLMVATLAGGGGAVVSHRAAAALWRLDGVRPDIVEISVPYRTRHRGT